MRFAVEVPTAGTYGLFFDFSHGDEVRTAAIIATATPSSHASARQHRTTATPRRASTARTEAERR